MCLLIAMLFFIYAIIGMQVGESLNLKICLAPLGYIKKIYGMRMMMRGRRGKKMRMMITAKRIWFPTGGRGL